MKNKEPLAPRKFGRPKTNLNESDKLLVLKIHKEQNSGARRLEEIELGVSEIKELDQLAE